MKFWGFSGKKMSRLPSKVKDKLLLLQYLDARKKTYILTGASDTQPAFSFK